jgi:hypothetical protein
VITQRALVDQLSRRDPGAWSVVERVQDIAFAAEQPALQRRDHRTRLTLVVHQDVPRGRGTARLDIDPFDGSPADIIDQALSLCATTVGPAWTSPPPAAPAKVDLADPDILQREIDAVALGTLSRLRRPDRVTTTASVEVLRERVTVIAGSGFHATWLATAVRVDAVLAAGDHSLAISRRARRADDLDIDATLATTAADLQLLAAAGPPSLGPCALWLGPEALLPSTLPGRTNPATIAGLGSGVGIAIGPSATSIAGDLHDHGLWSIFAQQADSAVERQGLTRYRLHAEIARGASQLADALTITSNGALDFAILSVPVSDEAVAIRSFPLINRGTAVGLGLSPREAAFRRTDPNGGVRNLIVSLGSWSPSPAASPSASASPSPSPASPSSSPSPPRPSIGRTLEIRHLHALAIDPYTGEATLDIALGLDHRPDRPEPTAFTGGTIRLDLVTALARAQRSNRPLHRGAYRGPDSILIDDAELIV